MPQPSWRTLAGIAKDAANALLTSAVAAAATSIPINGTNIPASSTITFVDGPNTEQRAVTAGGGTNTLTVAALTNAHPAGCYIFSQLTAAIGPADWIPVTVLEPEDQITQLYDKGIRGSAVENYNAVQGMRWENISLGGDVFVDTFPYFLGSVTGGVDFTGGTPNVFGFSVLNTGTTQPTPFGLWIQGAIDTRLYAGVKFEEVVLKYDPNMLLTYTAKGNSYMSGPATAISSPSYSTVVPSQAWLCAATIAGTAVPTVLSAEITVKRAVAPVLTLNGVQDPYKFWSDKQTVDGKATFVMEDNTQLNNFLNLSQPSVDITWTATGANPNYVKFHTTKANYATSKPKFTGGRGGYIELDVTFSCIANTTDATTAGGGYAPAKLSVANAVTTGHFQ